MTFLYSPSVASQITSEYPERKNTHFPFEKLHMLIIFDRSWFLRWIAYPRNPPQDVRKALTFAVVGAGASGCELSTKMADLLLDACKRRALHGEPRVLVIEMGDRVVPGMGEQIREFVEDALRKSHVEVHTLTRVVNVSSEGLTFEHQGKQEELKAAGVVWTGGVKMSPLIEHLDAEKNKRGLLVHQTNSSAH